MKKKIASIVLAGALAMTLAPAVAFAGGQDLAAGGVADTADATGTLDAMGSSKVTVTLIKTIGKNRFYYNGNGLILKSITQAGTKKYAYDGARVKSYSLQPTTSSPTKVSFTYDKKGRISKVKSSGASSYNTYITVKRYDGKNRVVKEVQNMTMLKEKRTTTYEYDGKSFMTSSSSTTGMQGSYAYDKKGNVKSIQYGGSYGMQRYFSMSYSYKSNGLIAKRVQSTNGTSLVTTDKFTYKKVKVPKKYASLIKKQQRFIAGNPNPALEL